MSWIFCKLAPCAHQPQRQPAHHYTGTSRTIKQMLSPLGLHYAVRCISPRAIAPMSQTGVYTAAPVITRVCIRKKTRQLSTHTTHQCPFTASRPADATLALATAVQAAVPDQCLTLRSSRTCLRQGHLRQGHRHAATPAALPAPGCILYRMFCQSRSIRDLVLGAARYDDVCVRLAGRDVAVKARLDRALVLVQHLQGPGGRSHTNRRFDIAVQGA
jgi:hypothetical protein